MNLMQKVIVFHFIEALLVEEFYEIRIYHSQEQLKHIEVPYYHDTDKIEFGETRRITVRYLYKENKPLKI